MKILLFDIETSPNLAYIWGIYEQNAISVERDWFVMCFAAKWLDEKRVINYSIDKFPLYKKDKFDDRCVLEQLWHLLDNADVVIAHNGDSFDIKKVNARFIELGFEPPSPYITVDTLKLARKHFKFDSNKLNDLGEHLHIGRKVKHEGFKLWKDCLNGKKSAWNLMNKYCKQDVVLLEKLYFKLLPWIKTRYNFNVVNNTSYACPTCGSLKLEKRGFNFTKTGKYQRFKCKDCLSWSQGIHNLLDYKIGVK